MMDTSQYHPNGMNNNNSPYSSMPLISPHQLQNSNLPPHTLPPLQAPQHATMQSLYGSAPHTPRTPATPNTPGSANTMGNFPQMGAQSRNYQMMPNNSYQQPPQTYRTSSSMMPQSSVAMSHPQPIAPAPAQNRLPQTLRPMPPNGLQHMQGSMQSPYGHNNMLSQLQDMEPPTHVVGSQGRRGILPSAPGRPAVSATGTGTGKNSMIPAKDADGKFPCPHCTKTYLHAKHLKRHLLRHTGDRPYMCVLCRDTFSRSDILKRHFQKCSIRRGNPTGASHLSHAQAHLKKSHPGPHKGTNSMSNENDLMGVNGMGNAPGGMPLFGVIPDGSMPESNLTDEQAEQLSRSNSMKRLSVGGGRDGRNMAGPGPGSSNRGGFEQSYGVGIANSMPSGMNPSLAFSASYGQNGHSYNQGYDYVAHNNGTHVQSQSSAGQDWPHLYQSSTQDGFMSQYSSNTANTEASVKSQPSIANSSSNVIFPTVFPSISSIPTWNLRNDPLQEISSRLMYLCFPSNQEVGHNHGIRKYLTADYVKHFLEQFTNFQGHFPILHLPTFQITEAFDGLLLAMICIGAVYSDHQTISPDQVREMMEMAKAVIERNSEVFAIISQDHKGNSGLSLIGLTTSELEQITAMLLLHILFIWHGTPLQRQKARQEFPLIVEMTRRAGLTEPNSNVPFSDLHKANVTLENFDATNFDWDAWVAQERRSRLMFTVYLLDCIMVLYFNLSPQFERHDIRLPLPADDAAWDAASSELCAVALGLYRQFDARSRNPAGSCRPKQPEMHSALSALMHDNCDIQPGATNLYSKFVLVHALHVELWLELRQLSMQESGHLKGPFPAFSSSGSSTPLDQNDWVRGVDRIGTTPQSASTSGGTTPVETANIPPQPLKYINNAFDKWKKLWDDDMLMQYPPAPETQRRFGFCRDGVHFYWLAKGLMKNSNCNLGLDWQMAPDQRFSQMIQFLKSVKSWVISDSNNRGELLGSVGDISKEYGVRDLTLDMAQLFAPIDRQKDFAVIGVRTGNGGNII